MKISRTMKKQASLPAWILISANNIILMTDYLKTSYLKSKLKIPVILIGFDWNLHEATGFLHLVYQQFVDYCRALREPSAFHKDNIEVDKRLWKHLQI
jgi:hypothetical protein